MALSARSVERAAALSVALLFAACTPAASAPAPAREPAHEPSPPAHEPTACESPLRAILDEPDRGADDRAIDRGRRAIELFELAGVRPGMHVAEIGAWKGYTAELLARAVAPDGSVYAVDPPELDKETRSAWEERRKRPASRRITRLARAYQDPFPPETPPLDAVFSVLFYHDMVWLGVDRAQMNAAIFRALKPGGVLVLADHSAKAGDGIGVARSLHRIEESVVKAELLRAGFVLDREADFLRHPEDTRDWSASDEAPKEKRGTSDRFVLRFRKPVPPAPAAPVFTHDPDAAQLVTSDIDHFWSAFDHAGDRKTLLAASIHEGSADFIGELISGMNTNKHLQDYGLAHERELWAEMSRSLQGTDHSRWLYNGDSSVDRPADLGYFVGARITKAYYDRAADKKQAIRDIVEVTDYDAFLAKSGYAEQWR